MITKYTYDTSYYQFRELFIELLGLRIRNLQNLHQYRGFDKIGNTPGNDNNSEWHKIFYEKMRGSYFIDCYKAFIENVIAKQFSEPVVYQKFPTLRISIPNGKGVADYHVDTQYAHPENEVNIWLPLTDSKESASIYIESEAGKGDYTSQNVKYGEYITFEGGKLSHGNEVNKTGKTRVSIDMRVIPQSLFKPSELKGLAYGKVRSTEGKDAYYSVIN